MLPCAGGSWPDNTLAQAPVLIPVHFSFCLLLPSAGFSAPHCWHRPNQRTRSVQAEMQSWCPRLKAAAGCGWPPMFALHAPTPHTTPAWRVFPGHAACNHLEHIASVHATTSTTSPEDQPSLHPFHRFSTQWMPDDLPYMRPAVCIPWRQPGARGAAAAAFRGSEVPCIIKSRTYGRPSLRCRCLAPTWRPLSTCCSGWGVLRRCQHLLWLGACCSRWFT